MVHDSELVRQLQKGSLEALGLLYDRHQRLVYRTALGITGDSESAADLLQDVFLRLHRFSGHVDPNRPLEPWLYRMTANLSYTWLKRGRRWLRSIEDMAEWLAGSRRNFIQDAAPDDEEWQSVRQALQAIPLQQRTVVVLYYLNDLSLQEISDILEIPVGTVKSRLHYAREALRKYLAPPQTEAKVDFQCEFT